MSEFYQSKKTGKEIDAAVTAANVTLPNEIVTLSDNINDLNSKKADKTEVPKSLSDLGFNSETYSVNLEKILDTDSAKRYLIKQGENIIGYIDVPNSYTKGEVDSKLSSVYKYKGTVNTINDLPTTGLTVGDVYNIETSGTLDYELSANNNIDVKAGDNIAWTENGWDILAGIVDTSVFALKQTENGGFIGGNNATANTGGAIGINSSVTGGGAIGDSACALDGGAVGKSALSNNGGAVGSSAIAGDGFAGGKNAQTMDYGKSEPVDAIQLGTGINSNPKTLQVYDYILMNADGSIPNERLTNAYTKTEMDAILNEKAGKATTLAGYGITDAYTKTETDATFALMENAVINISKRYICSSTDGSVSSLDLSSSADIPLFNINGLDNGALPDDISSICQGIFKFRYIYPEVYTDITVMQQLMYADSASGSYIFVCTAFEKGRIYSRRVDADKDTGTGEFVFTYGKWNCIDGGDKADKSDVYTKTETDTALEAKADKATTLIGYGITDAYTKTEADTVLEAKADKATTLAGYGITDAYTKNEAEAALATKADKTAITASTDGSITLADNTEFRVADTVTSISLTIPDDIPNDFISSVVFKSGTEAMAIDYSAVSPIWRGDDVTDGVFIPLANKVYNVIFYNDGFNITAVAGGYDI